MRTHVHLSWPVGAQLEVRGVGLLRPRGQTQVTHAVIKHKFVSHVAGTLDVCVCSCVCVCVCVRECVCVYV